MKKILVIGAGFLQSFVIKRAKQLGYEVLAVDANPDACGFQYADRHKVISIIDEKACLEYAKEEAIDGVLTAATEYGVLTAAYIAEKMGLRGLSYEAAKLVKNKYKVRKCLYENNVDDTEQAYEIDGETDFSKIVGKIEFPVMVKPCDGSGSRGASRVDSEECFEGACKIAMDASVSHRATVESFIFGKEYGAESLVVDGEVHVLSIMRKWMTEPPYYAELGHAIPTDLPYETESKARECVKRAIKALGINFGSVNMDMLITESGSVHIIDIGARMGGNMIGPFIIPYGTGIDYMTQMIRNAAGDCVTFTENERTPVVTRLITFESGVVTTLPDFEKIERDFGVEIYHHLTLGQRVNEYHTNLDGCGYIIAVADTVEKAIVNADGALKVIRDTVFK